MPKAVPFCPFQEFYLGDGLWAKPDAFLHLLGSQYISASFAWFEKWACSVPQSPFFMNVTILVENKATQMSMSRGTRARRVNRPAKRSAPQMISVTPMKGAMSCGKGMPIFAKRPTPNDSGNT